MYGDDLHAWHAHNCLSMTECTGFLHAVSCVEPLIDFQAVGEVIMFDYGEANDFCDLRTGRTGPTYVE